MWGKNAICFKPDRVVGGSGAREIQIMEISKRVNPSDLVAQNVDSTGNRGTLNV